MHLFHEHLHYGNEKQGNVHLQVWEEGIDTGAMSQEFLSQAIGDMAREFFPDGTPTDSTCHVQNGNFRTCGEIAAVSLAQGGPPPCFLEQCAFNLLSTDVNMVNIQDSDLTTKEQNLLQEVKVDCSKFTDIIFEHGYQGPVDEQHVEDIIRSLKVSFVNRRSLYMKEFMVELSIHGLADLIKSNPNACQPLFVNGKFKEQLSPDANYLFSIMRPQYSEMGSSRHVLEEQIMDHFQDCLNLFEDGGIEGHEAAVAWNYEDDTPATELGEVPKEAFEAPAMTVEGVMGWLTGQKHKPLNDQQFSVTVRFNHECMKKNPNHTVCFPTVGACGKEITFPTAHMASFSEFKEMFTLAFCKGQAFGRP